MSGDERPKMEVALMHAKENAGDLGPKYKECLEIADKALKDRALAEEIVQKGFGHCEAVKAICEKYKTEVSREPTGPSAGKTAKEIGAMCVTSMGEMHTWPGAFKEWAKGCAGKGDAGVKEALGGVVTDGYNVRGLQYIRDELRRDIAAEMMAAGFAEAFLENVGKL
jgi:hypothetical protein